MKGKNLLITLAASAMLFSGCGIKSAETIIKVNDMNISQAQFDAELDKEAKVIQASPLKVNIKDANNVFMYNLVKSRIVNELIIKTLLDDEIAKRGIKVTNDDINDAIKDIVEKVGSKENLDKILKQNGVSASEFKKDLKEQVKMKKLAESLGSYEVTDADAKEFYNKNIEKFKFPDKVRASHILIAVNPEEITEIIKSDSKNANLSEAEVKAKVQEEIKAKEAKAKELFNQAKQDPSNFAKLAKDNSDDTVSAQKGGDLGFFAKQEMVPEFANASFGAKPETVVGPVKTQYGYHIIYVKDRMAAGQKPFEKEKNSIKEHIKNQKQLEKVDQLVESLKKNAKIEYVNKDYDPEEVQKAVQKAIMDSSEAAQKAAKDNAKE
ncbi:MAG: peptidylprolyl isomerase [Candidatus Gastranaerophilaceae bacterium]|nr:peptidylprolyl isomerase [Candidatus Gastranaerophilaceae bacterium]